MFSTGYPQPRCDEHHPYEYCQMSGGSGMFYLPTKERGSMARAISVKVARTKVIDALTNKLQEMKLAKEAYEQATEQWETDTKEWRNKVSQIALENVNKISADDKEICIRNWGYNSDKQTRVEVTLTLDNSVLPAEPQRPKDPFQSYGYGRQHVGNYDDRVAEILNAINILKMSDEEVVSTSTYQHVARYL